MQVARSDLQVNFAVRNGGLVLGQCRVLHMFGSEYHAYLGSNLASLR